MGDGLDQSQPAKDRRPGVLVANEFFDHPKIAPLSDGAKLLLIEAWCYASRLETDGRIPDAVWKRMGTPKARAELMAPPQLQPDAAPMIAQRDGYVEAHDYLAHQRSRSEIQSLREARGASGEKGAHKRWHVGARRFDPECVFCVADRDSARNPA